MKVKILNFQKNSSPPQFILFFFQLASVPVPSPFWEYAQLCCAWPELSSSTRLLRVNWCSYSIIFWQFIALEGKYTLENNCHRGKKDELKNSKNSLFHEIVETVKNFKFQLFFNCRTFNFFQICLIWEKTKQK